MCILKKIAIIQKNLLETELPKSGHNKFAGFDYHELEDILPSIQLECFKQELILLFDFTEKQAILKVTNWNDLKDYVEFTVPMPVIQPMNKKMNVMQSEGAYITYLKKYLLGNAFLILERSVVETLPHEVEEDHKDEPLIKEKPAKPETPAIINDALIDLDKKGVPITRASLFSKCSQLGLKKDERKAVTDWIKKNIKEDSK